MGYSLNKNNPVWEQIADYTAIGTLSSYTFTGLSIGKSDELLLIVDIVNETYANPAIYITINENNTLTNYYTQILTVDNTTIGKARNNNPTLMSSGSFKKNTCIANIRLTQDGNFCCESKGVVNYPGATHFNINYFIASTFTSETITSVKLTDSVGETIVAGSRFQLYRLRAEKVLDLTIEAETTSVNIDNLIIDKSSEYLLITELYNPSAGTNGLQLIINNNTTLTNYYTQFLYVTGSSNSALRENAPYLMEVSSGHKSLAITAIKLSNSGYAEWQTNANRCYNDASLIRIEKQYGTSTFTMSSITQLTLTAYQANGIGIGSRFQLYKLKGGA